MRNLHNSHESTRQNGQNVKKSQKHDANLQKNTTLYFQIGLIVCLLSAFGLLEMKFKTETLSIGTVLPPDDDIEYVVNNFQVYQEHVAQKVTPKSKANTRFIEKYKEVDDNVEEEGVKDLIIPDTPKTTDSPIKPEDIDVVDIDVPVDIPVNFIQNVPIYPGCENEKTNDQRIKCMTSKISKIVQRKFNTDLASELGLYGKQVIQTQFTINKNGIITNVKTRAIHKDLESEAQRVINLLPEMTPGRQNNKNVGVIYTLPIVFQVQ
ncbi:energy transducer TonB [Neotamlana laminarinivorans]|uniref:Energy transducer TonB n=1 Tax=Neotamlana laminarinivorans TaxID=2883124 RepID=A0A9X1L4Z9_9FLAO|nr:energy transducer TonB [Tamlana laminarinivorans]MCB4799887.1 energy transducer TonB [Tamlana laminarinivorans]